MGLTGISGPSGLSAIMGGGNGGGCSATINRSRRFERGNLESLSAAAAAAFAPGADADMSACGWVNPTTIPTLAPTPVIFNLGGFGADEILLYITVTTGALRAFFNDVGVDSVDFAHGSSLSAGTWYFWALYLDASANEVGLSLNNGAFTTAAFTGSLDDATMAFRLGGRTGQPALNWDGDQQQQLYCNGGIFSAADLTKLYNAGAGADYRNLTLSVAPTHTYPLNEESGNAIASEGGINLTDNNGVTNAPGKFLSCA